MCSLESPYRGDSNDYIQHTIILEDRKGTVRLSTFASWPGAMINSQWLERITKTCLYNFDPIKPHFYTVKLGFTGVYIIFLISAQNIDCGTR